MPAKIPWGRDGGEMFRGYDSGERLVVFGAESATTDSPNHKFGPSGGMEHVGMTAPASAVTKHHQPDYPVTSSCPFSP